jgi:hypothetical protein
MLDVPRAILALSRARFDDRSGRPRELFTALARHREVIFCEEPVAAEPGVSDSWELQFPAPHLVVCRPVLAASGDGFANAPHARVASMLVQLLRWQDVGEFVAWVDTPHALPVARRLAASLVVYDCEHAFRSAQPEEDARRETDLDGELLRAADLVVVAEPSAEPLSWTRAAERMLADLDEAERAPRALRRRRSLRPPPARRVRREGVR